jgi:2-dehydropantoate 2-reductase
MLAMLAECASVAKAEGFATPEPVLQNYRGMLTLKGSLISASMLRDVESGGQAEGDHILGVLLERAQKAGVATPLLEVAAAHLETYAARRKRQTLADRG